MRSLSTGKRKGSCLGMLLVGKGGVGRRRDTEGRRQVWDSTGGTALTLMQ
jgi:hypothetical protein